MSEKELLQQVEDAAREVARQGFQHNLQDGFMSSDYIGAVVNYQRAIENAGGPLKHTVAAARTRGSLKASRQQSF